MPRVSDWIDLCCGDYVCRKDDPRHIGRVEAVHFGAFVKVRWLDSKFTSQENRDDLCTVEKVEERLSSKRKGKVLSFTKRPRTIVESPRAALERMIKEDRERKDHNGK